MHDVLILGAGLAGQRAALAAAQTGASVAIVSNRGGRGRGRLSPNPRKLRDRLGAVS
jgi:succinate dehydrogenase/fumarate reductase flavoprotein subunit